MKINDSQRIGTYRTYQQTTDVRSNESSAKRRKDEVHFSSEAMGLLGSQNRADATELADRIERLKREVSMGTYHVDSDKLAEKMLPFFFPLRNKE